MPQGLADQIKTGPVRRRETSERMPQIMEPHAVQFGDFTDSILGLVEAKCWTIATRRGEDIRPRSRSAHDLRHSRRVQRDHLLPGLGAVPRQQNLTALQVNLAPGQVQYLGIAGAPGTIRTSDSQIRSLEKGRNSVPYAERTVTCGSTLQFI